MKQKLLTLLIVGVWLGMVCGISFLEAPLKFQAPNITTLLGLSIGKLVFSALNKIELVFTVIISSCLICQYNRLNTTTVVVFSVLTLLILVQTLWLLPILNGRVDALLQGIEVTKSNHHFYYIGFEIVKVVLLIIGFTKIYNHD